MKMPRPKSSNPSFNTPELQKSTDGIRNRNRPITTSLPLKYGANDLGSIMIEENVVSQAGATHRTGTADMQRLIRELGYEPRQRDNWYRLVN